MANKAHKAFVFSQKNMYIFFSHVISGFILFTRQKKQAHSRVLYSLLLSVVLFVTVNR